MSALEKIRSRKVEETEEWQLSLADMMTLLLCFFILLASVSQVDKSRYEEVAEALSQHMNKDKKAKQASDNRLQQLQAIYQDMSRRFAGAEDKVGVHMGRNKVTLNLKGSTFFASGSVHLTPEARQLLSQVAAPLRGVPYKLTIEGHTDNIPMSAGLIASNWELSALRASSVARFLLAKGVHGAQLQVVGLADTKPLVANTDKSGRAIPKNQQRNRRVVILVEPADR